MNQMFVKPAKEGYLVRKGLGQPYLDAGGEWVPETTYWLRRVMMADVVKCQPPKPEVEVKKPATVSRTKGNK